jgi:hypothetical protein
MAACESIGNGNNVYLLILAQSMKKANDDIYNESNLILAAMI